MKIYEICLKVRNYLQCIQSKVNGILIFIVIDKIKVQLNEVTTQGFDSIILNKLSIE